MSRLEQKKEQKRRDILHAALEVFLKNGYLGASMDQIAQQAGVTKQTVYRYFESKEILFQAALEAQRAESGVCFAEALDREDPYEALLKFSLGFLERHLSEAHLAGVRLLIAEGPSAPEMTRAFFAVGPDKTEARLMRFFETRRQVEDPEYAVKMFLGALLSMRMNVLVGLRPVPTKEELVRHAKRTVDACMKLFGG
ncbi:MAG: TetR/AcrR family transcriptional regulator, mexJK operon transcriptional repressor [Desulfovibrionales bacterium]|jgi:AcrR family transcriptional regulator|nr:TetR/AcrR family transcriptional regulator, mexJK operon transcriptional repressor [Desulfovibrionales bacterium]